ncbi:MAG: F0F1 ATP synthase subunit A [Lachnospiraceae bacterium]|nr:F0F1 ATP synthase subunit A [Lachnospiraceae bacterium]
MSKKRIIVSALFFVAVITCLLVGIFLTNDPNHVEEETIQEVMKEAVLHEHVKVSLFGIKDVNPALISAFIVTGIILVVSLILRIFFIPRFKLIPEGKIQIILEMAVGLFDGTSKSNSPHKYRLLRVYMFVAGTYIFVSTVFELLGVQVMSTAGKPITLSAPLADINGAIMLGATTYTFILFNGLFVSGFRGLIGTLKDFSLPISMSLRLFGALLSGALVTELVYYYRMTSFVIPVFVAIAFTLMHAIIQAYVLTMLLSIFYGEVTEPHEKKEKKQKKIKNKNQENLSSEVLQ